MNIKNKTVKLISSTLLISASDIYAAPDPDRNRTIVQQCIQETYQQRVNEKGEVTYQANNPEDFMHCLKRKVYQHPDQHPEAWSLINNSEDK